MYKRKKFKQKKQLGIGSVLIISILISVVSIFLYNMYENITVTPSQSTSNTVGISKTSANISNTSMQSDSSKITDVLESISDTVVGISKIKNTGLSIFLQDGPEQMGLGTGFIVSENGYIITNQHVARQ